MHYLHKLILPVPAILGYIFAVKDLPHENAGIFFFQNKKRLTNTA